MEIYFYFELLTRIQKPNILFCLNNLRDVDRKGRHELLILNAYLMLIN